jgi:hypothetical protein
VLAHEPKGFGVAFPNLEAGSIRCKLQRPATRKFKPIQGAIRLDPAKKSRRAARIQSDLKQIKPN